MPFKEILWRFAGYFFWVVGPEIGTRLEEQILWRDIVIFKIPRNM